MTGRSLGCLLQGCAVLTLSVGVLTAMIPVFSHDVWRGAPWTRWTVIAVGLVLLVAGALLLRKGNRLSREPQGSEDAPGVASRGDGVSQLLRRIDAEMTRKVPGALEPDVDFDFSWFLLLLSTPCLLYAVVAAASLAFFPEKSRATPWHVLAAVVGSAVFLLWGGGMRVRTSRLASDAVVRGTGVSRIARALGAASPAALSAAQGALRNATVADRDARIAAALSDGFGGAVVGLGVVCPRCERAGATGFAEFREVIGAFVVHKSRVESGWFCGPCARDRFWPMTLATAALGGLGHHSILLAFAVFASNIAWYARSRTLGAPREGRARLSLPVPAIDALAPHATELGARLSSKESGPETLQSGPWRRVATPLEIALYLVAIADLLRSAREVLPRDEGLVSQGVEVRPSPRHGTGLFTTRAVRRGNGVYSVPKGRVVNGAEIAGLSALERNHLDRIGDDLYEVIEPPGCHINHSCDPNVEERDRRGIALRDLAAGEEITLDYDRIAHLDEPFPCRCGARACRGSVRGRS